MTAPTTPGEAVDALARGLGSLGPAYADSSEAAALASMIERAGTPADVARLGDLLDLYDCGPRVRRAVRRHYGERVRRDDPSELEIITAIGRWATAHLDKWTDDPAQGAESWGRWAGSLLEVDAHRFRGALTAAGLDPLAAIKVLSASVRLLTQASSRGHTSVIRYGDRRKRVYRVRIPEYARHDRSLCAKCESDVRAGRVRRGGTGRCQCRQGTL